MRNLASRLLGCLISLGLVTTSIAAARASEDTGYAVGPQYDTAHVYVAAEDFDRFVASLLATFGGKATQQGVFQVTPTPSQTISQLVLTPAGTISVFGFKTPIPYPFGDERGGYLVSDIDAAVASARAAGANRVVETFPDPIGRDAIVQWPGGVTMQLYWHTKPSDFAPLATVPEDRVYLTADGADPFIKAWKTYSHGEVTSDVRDAAGSDIGLSGKAYRRVQLSSVYGKETVIVTDGSLPWPYGRDRTGYAVDDLDATLARAEAAGATVLVAAHAAEGRRGAIVRFPGGHIAEIHSTTTR